MKIYFGIGVVLLMIFKEAGGQEISFEPVRYLTTCTDGLRNTIDQFAFTGTVGKNYSEYKALGWETLIYVEILKPGSTKFETVCPVIIGDPEAFCGPSLFNCSCDSVNSNGTVYFTVNYVAHAYYSHGIIRGKWSNTKLNQTNYSKNNLTLRAMYDVNQTSQELKINNHLATEKGGSCGVDFVSQEDNTISLCCLNTASPCYPKLSFDGQVVASGKEKCVNYTYKPHNISYRVSVTLSYSVCTQTDTNYVMAYSCVIKAASSSGNDGGLDDNSKIIIGVVIGAACLIAIIVGVIFYYKKTKKCSKTKTSSSYQMNTQSTESLAQTSHHDLCESTPRKDSKHEESIRPDNEKTTETVVSGLDRNQHDNINTNHSGDKNQSGNGGIDNSNQSHKTSQLENTNTNQTEDGKQVYADKPRPLPQPLKKK